MKCKDCYHFVSHMRKYYPKDWESRVESLIYFPCTRLVRFKSPNSKICELFTDKNINQPGELMGYRRLEIEY